MEQRMLANFVPYLKSSWLMKAGLLGFIAGFGMIIYAGFNKVPARAELQKVSGVFAEGKQISKTTKRRGQSTGTVKSVFEIGVRQANGQMRTLNLDGTWVSRDKLEAVIGGPIEAEVDEGENVLVLSARGQPVLAYETSAKGYDIDNKKYREIAAPLMVFGLPLLLIGWFWTARSARKAAAQTA